MNGSASTLSIRYENDLVVDGYGQTADVLAAISLVNPMGAGTGPP